MKWVNMFPWNQPPKTNFYTLNPYSGLVPGKVYALNVFCRTVALSFPYEPFGVPITKTVSLSVATAGVRADLGGGKRRIVSFYKLNGGCIQFH